MNSEDAFWFRIWIVIGTSVFLTASSITWGVAYIRVKAFAAGYEERALMGSTETIWVKK